jgi:hypothetical protein
MPLVILHHLLNVSVQLANKRGFTKKKKRSREMFLAPKEYYLHKKDFVPQSE